MDTELAKICKIETVDKPNNGPLANNWFKPVMEFSKELAGQEKGNFRKPSGNPL